jgi:hypothetical protein
MREGYQTNFVYQIIGTGVRRCQLITRKKIVTIGIVQTTDGYKQTKIKM